MSSHVVCTARPHNTVIIDPALSYCLLPDDVFIAETNQQAFDGQGGVVILKLSGTNK